MALKNNLLKYNSEKFDSSANTFRKIYSNPVIDNFRGSVILPLDFSLEMDGIGGIIPHSAFEIPTDSLPSNYIVKTGDSKGLSKIAFILHTIDHNFNNNKWTTKITGQTLSIRYDELTEEQKASIKVKQQPLQQVITPIEGYSVTKGGSTKNIKGTTYKNGEIPTSKLKTILNESKYNNPAINKSDGGRVRLFTDTSLALDKLLAAATHANIKLKINSAYRTYEDQERVFKNNCSNAIGTGKCQIRPGKKLTAIPGTSNHGFGLAIDLANLSGTLLNTSMPEYKWVAENAPRFGFKRIASEAWHWEYQIT
jgi:LAS superfamily LD-carboxypeptidase LdcB